MKNLNSTVQQINYIMTIPLWGRRGGGVKATTNLKFEILLFRICNFKNYHILTRERKVHIVLIYSCLIAHLKQQNVSF